MEKYFNDIVKHDGTINASMLQERYVRIHYPELHVAILANFNCDDKKYSFAQKVYNYRHKLSEIPKCPTCKTGEPKFSTYTIGYLQYCSRDCQGASDTVKAKRESTVVDRLGVTNVFKDPSVKAAAKQTIMERTGYDNASKDPAIKRRKIDTTMKNYGVAHHMADPEVQRHRQATNMKRYGAVSVCAGHPIWQAAFEAIHGVSNSSYIQACVDKRKMTNDIAYRQKLKDIGLNAVKMEGSIVEILCDICNRTYTIEKYNIYNRIKYGAENICTHCNPITEIKHSFQEDDLANAIAESLEVTPIRQDRSLGFELDILLQAHNIAVEFDGLYWHCELYKQSKYHVDKTERAAKRGIRVIHVFEDEWKYRRDIVLSCINAACGKFESKIMARKCEVIEISAEKYAAFCNANHLQGYAQASIKIALTLNDEIISVMSFSKPRVIYKSGSRIDDEYEMIRQCNKRGVMINGGASKMFKHFVRKYVPARITTYADRRWFTGEVYERLGFSLASVTPPNYWYVINDTRAHRFQYRKDVLVRHGFDAKQSEHDIMLSRGIFRIYDCGNLKYVWLNK